ncbi:MAG: HAMP domain-containing sensor histidine kinase [Cyanobacteria bacterium J06598_1]
MSAIASSEFVSLCQAQLRLLTQQMSAASAAVYITDYLDELTRQTVPSGWERRQRSEPNFIPVVSYPESIDSWIEKFERATAWHAPQKTNRPLLPGSQDVDLDTDRDIDLLDDTNLPKTDLPETGRATDQTTDRAMGGSQATTAETTPPEPSGDWPEILQADHQLVVPLVYADVVVGLMVTIRGDRAWENEERHYVEGIAQSLAAGCVLERRTQWLQSQLTSKRELQSRQSEIFHNLLHQFRNPLTAVTTFGQLLVRRLELEDPNQKIATGIVRESKRLREMVSHFDETVALGDADLHASPSGPLLLPPVAGKSESTSTSVGLLPGTTEPAEASAIEDNMGAGLGTVLSLSAQYLPDIVEPILAVADIVAKEKGVVIKDQVATDTPAVWGEEEALGEVVSNLVDNALKYASSGACVWIQTGVSRAGKDAHYQGIVVGDTGPGIPASDLTHLFERNYRGVQAVSDIPGTGLGLAIAQTLMAQMQGSIEVITPAVGTPWMPQLSANMANTAGPGTVFIVWLQEVEDTR